MPLQHFPHWWTPNSRISRGETCKLHPAASCAVKTVCLDENTHRFHFTAAGTVCVCGAGEARKWQNQSCERWTDGRLQRRSRPAGTRLASTWLVCNRVSGGCECWPVSFGGNSNKLQGSRIVVWLEYGWRLLSRAGRPDAHWLCPLQTPAEVLEKAALLLSIVAHFDCLAHVYPDASASDVFFNHVCAFILTAVVAAQAYVWTRQSRRSPKEIHAGAGFLWRCWVPCWDHSSQALRAIQRLKHSLSLLRRANWGLGQSWKTSQQVRLEIHIAGKM